MYSARITRQNPTAFIFLIDHSGSMEEKMPFGSAVATKAEVVAMVTNRLLCEVINRCRRDDGIADYFDIAAIGYSGERARMLLSDEVTFMKPSRLARQNCRNPVLSPNNGFIPTEVHGRYQPNSNTGSSPVPRAIHRCGRPWIWR